MYNFAEVKERRKIPGSNVAERGGRSPDQSAQEDRIMLYWAAVFFIVAIVAGLFGFGGIAVAAVEIAKILFYVFLVLFVLSLLSGLHRRHRIW